jgi:amino acid adenylation domain-containing protein
MNMYQTLLECLNASAQGGKGIRFITGVGQEEFLAYRQLRDDALGRLAGLRKLGIQVGDELVFQYASLREFMITYWACIAGAIIPVPLEFASQATNAEKVFTVWKTLNNAWLASDSANLADRLEAFAAQTEWAEQWAQMRGRLVFPTDVAGASGDCRPADATPSDIAFIQFSSGSTSAPKGVVLTHANLLANIDDILAAVDYTEADTFLSWKPITHDFGMIAFHLAPIVAGSDQIRIATEVFIWNPSLWFAAADKYRASILGSPNFGYRHFLKLYRKGKKKPSWDLSCIKVILNGAEPISAELCEEFRRELACFGLPPHCITPGYGLAEGSLIASLCPIDEGIRTMTVDRHHLRVGDRLQPVEPGSPQSITFVDCGLPFPKTDIRITGKGRLPLPEDQVGHIEIRGDAVTSGYYRDPQSTAALIGPGGWLDTQDLGVLREGRLFVVGRVKEMLIIGGINYFPHDIEQAILRARGEDHLNKYIVCGVYNSEQGREEPVIFVYAKHTGEGFAALAAELRQVVMATFALPVVNVVPVKKIPKTTSGKVQRFKLVQDYLDGKFDEALNDVGEVRAIRMAIANIELPVSYTDAPAQTEDGIIVRTRRIAARLLGHPDIDQDSGFFDLGFSSLSLMVLRERLEEEFGVSLESTSPLDFPNVRSLAAHIALHLAVGAHPAPVRTSLQESLLPEATHHEPVAIIGMGCRFPGGADSPESFWNLLNSGIDPIGEMPPDRWQSDPQAHADLTTRQGGFLDAVDRFDPLFFGISPTEAEAMDPQQRLLLEVCHETIENAGLNSSELAGSRTGVFIGMSGSEYAAVGKDMGHFTGPYSFTGTMFNTACGRISYTFGFQGPCVAIDTACSSSLVAVNQGLHELRSNTCDLVVAGGVNLILRADGHVSFSQLNALSSTGRCRSFDESADGYIRSEGCGLVLLKRLSDAKRDEDTILAVIRGGAVNHNGKSGGLTVPNGSAQEALILQALADADIGPAEVDYVEAHGSGTRLGDPQELNALARVFSARNAPLRVGSVKSNLGHLESAAGIAGLIKLVLCLRHQAFAPNLHFRHPNSLIDWEKALLLPVTAPLAWAAEGKTRTAGISSFGISGTNAHLLLQEYPCPVKQAEAGRAQGSFVFTLSAKSPEGLRLSALKFANYPKLETLRFADLCRTVNRLRVSHSNRWACSAANAEDLRQKLLRFANHADRVETDGDMCPSRKIVFLYTGQGSYYPGMGEALYRDSPVFKDAFDQCDALFAPLIGCSLRDYVYAQLRRSSDSAQATQSAIFAVGYALSRFWEALGIRPSAVIGHSIGEYAAACESGIMSLENAVQMVALRGAIMEQTPADGAMTGILSDEAIVRKLCEDCGGGVYLAAINGDENITVSGQKESVARLVASAKKARIFTEALPMSHAFHSPLMGASAGKLKDGLAGIRFSDPKIPLISTQSGRVLSSADEAGADYWSAHLCNTVRFKDAMLLALGTDAATFLEIGGTATLSGLGAQIGRGDQLAFLPSLREGRDAWEQVSQSLAVLFRRGYSINWDAYHNGVSSFITDLPNTAYQRNRFWFSDNSPARRSPAPVPLTLAYSTASEAAVLSGEATAASPMTSESSDLQAVQRDIKDIVSRVTGVPPSEIADQAHLFSLGIDSLMLMQMDKQVVAKYGVDIPLKRFFTDLHTPEKIALFVAAEMPAGLRATPSTPALLSAPSPQPQLAVPGQAISQLEHIVQTQLELMREQIALLNGQTTAHTASLETSKVAAKPAEVARPKTNLRDITLHEEDVTPRQRVFINRLIQRVNQSTPKSKNYAQTYRRGFADWIASLNFSLTTKELVYPVVSARSKGSRFWDIDGNEYIDTAIGYGVSFFGNNPDFIAEAIQAQLGQGIELGPQSDLVGEVAERIRRLTGVERVAFCNTGTEAVMVAIRLARAVTRRLKIVRFITSFHGSFDGVLAEAGDGGTVPMAPGIPQSMVEDTVVLHYGSPESLATIREMGAELAAVLVEPVQSRNPGLQPREYLQELRKITADAGIALIFDEMITGFRIHTGGAQAYFDVRADLVTYGKIVGGGMPVGVVGGSARYMDAIDGGVWNFGDTSGPSAETTFFAGTFCKHPLTMAASRAVLEKLETEGALLIERTNDLTRRFTERANVFFEESQAPVQVKRFGSMYRFEARVSQDIPRLSLEMNLFFRLMMLEGVYVWERRTCFFSTAHTEADAGRILGAVKAATDELRRGGFSFRAVSEPDGGGSKIRGGESGLTSSGPRFLQLSSEERRIYILSLMKGGEAAYHVTGALLIKGLLEPDRVRDVFRVLTRRHEAMRTLYRVQDGEIRRQVESEVDIVMECRDSTDGIESSLMGQMVRPFDPSKAPLWRIGLIRRGLNENVLVLDFHHLIADGRSMSILIQDFIALWQGETGLRGMEPRPYADFAEWECGFVGSGDYLRQKAYWLKAFEVLPPPLGLPTDSPRPPQNDFAGASLNAPFKQSVFPKVREIARQLQVTPFMVLLSAYFALLHKLTGQDDLCVGIPFDRRVNRDFDQTVGMFSQTLMIRVLAGGDLSFGHLLAQVREACALAFAHPDVPLDELLEELSVPRDFSRNPLFDTLFIFENGNDRVTSTSDLSVETLPVPIRGAAFDLTIEITEERGLLSGVLIYATRLFSETTIKRWAGYYEALLERAMDNPEIRIKDLDMLVQGERNLLLSGFNDTARAYPPQETVVTLFRRAAACHADRLAVRCGTKNCLTYAELDAASDDLAKRLVSLGIGAGSLVGILLRRGPAMPVAMLGVLKAGAAYVPLDPDYPPARLRYMLERCEAKVVLSKAGFAEELGFTGIVLDPDGDTPSPPAALPKVISSDGLAYVIFTSGSTGKPKGVMIEHQAVVNFLHGMKEALDVPDNISTLGLTTISFDIFVLEVFLTFVQGGTLVLATEAEQNDPKELVRLIKSMQGGLVQITPSRLQMLLSAYSAQEALAGLGLLLVGGEAFPSHHLADLKAVPGLRIFNMYGPTETTVWSSVKDLTHADAVTIGKPIANTQVYVLGSDSEVLPVGSVGDLYIAGAGLARGYLGDEAQTATAFVLNAYALGQRMYRTGDRAAWTINGELIYQGRCDQQIKLRGHRIELAEIEKILLEHPSVRNAAVAIRELSPSNAVLVAYCQATDTPKPGFGEELRAHGARHLPDYMVPAIIVPVEYLPMTPNGKIDRNNLPTTLAEVSRETLLEAVNTEGLAGEILKVWKAILGGDRPIGFRDSFFDLGGNSLSLVLMHSAIAEKYPGTLEVADIFANPTIAALQNFIQRQIGEELKPVAFPEEFTRVVGLDGGVEGSLQAEISGQWYDKLTAAAGDVNAEPREIALALYLFYLNKLLNAHQLSLALADGHREANAVLDIDMHNLRTVADILRTLRDRRRLAVVSLGRSHAARTGLSLLFVFAEGIGKIQRQGFDIVFHVASSADKLHIGVEYDASRLEGERMKSFIANYIKLLKAVVGAGRREQIPAVETES